MASDQEENPNWGVVLMNDTRQLRTEWMTKLKELRITFGTTPPMRRDYKANLELCLRDVARAALQEADPFIPAPNKQEAQQRVQTKVEQIVAANHGRTVKLRGDYAKLHLQWSRYADERRQHNWATTWDYAKMFLSRTAQAVMIAVVVLYASYWAKELGIPLPHFRIAP